MPHVLQVPVFQTNFPWPPPQKRKKYISFSGKGEKERVEARAQGSIWHAVWCVAIVSCSARGYCKWSTWGSRRVWCAVWGACVVAWMMIWWRSCRTKCLPFASNFFGNEAPTLTSHYCCWYVHITILINAWKGWKLACAMDDFASALRAVHLESCRLIVSTIKFSLWKISLKWDQCTGWRRFIGFVMI